MDLIKKIKNYTYNQRHCLGQGSFGKVFQGKADDGHKVAIKKVQQRVVSQDSYLKSALQTQINIMKKLNHPNIVYLEDVVLTQNSIYLIMQYCSGGDLKRYCRNRKINEQQATQIIKQITKGFQQICKHGIIHRDLKPANILVHQGIFKICDFGFAKYFGQAKMAQTCVGTPIYMSPQVLSKKHYTDKTDVWSLGVLYFELVFNKLPFTAASQQQLYKKILQNPKAPLSIASNSSKFIQNFLKGTLQVDQKNRWGWQQVFQAFELVQFKQYQNSHSRNGSHEKKNSSQNLFYKNQSTNYKNDGQISIQKKEQPSTAQNLIKNLFNFMGRDKAAKRNNDSSQSKSKEKSQRVKPKPKNLLALQYINEQSPHNIQKNSNNNNSLGNQIGPFPKNNNFIQQQNVRFLYFILVECIFEQNSFTDSVPSFKSFLSCLYKYTINAYQNKIQSQQQNENVKEYNKVLMSELEQIKNLYSEIPNIKDKQVNPRKIGQIVLMEIKKNQSYQSNQIKEWIQRFLQKNYAYTPLIN